MESTVLRNTSQGRCWKSSFSSPLTTPHWWDGSAWQAEPQSKERQVPKSSLLYKSRAVALTHPKQADQRRHIIGSQQDTILFKASLLRVSSKLRRCRGRGRHRAFHSGRFLCCLQPAGGDETGWLSSEVLCSPVCLISGGASVPRESTCFTCAVGNELPLGTN